MTAAVRYTQQITVVNYRRAVSVINASPSTPSAPGSGSGDVVGPASAVTGRLAVFIGTTGKLIADGGAAIADLATAAQGDLADSAAQPADLASAISAHAGASDPHGDRAYTDGEVSAMAGATAAALATKLAAVPAGTAAEIVGATASGTTLQRLGYTIATLLAAARGRATHTGSQLANTISDFATAVQAMFGSTAGTICEGNDSRLSDARTPAAHTSSHQSGGTDAIKLDDLATPDDNTDLNATTSRHGLLPKLSGVATEYLDGTGAFSTPSGGGGSSNTKWIGAGELIPRVTNGAGIDGEELATNDINLDYLAFDPATSEGAQVAFAWPSGFSTFTATFHWTAASGSGGVRWQCSSRGYADDDALDQAQGTSQAVSDTLLAANDAHRSSATSAITPAGTASAGNLCVIEVERDPSHGDDTLAVDARLIGVLLEFA